MLSLMLMIKTNSFACFERKRKTGRVGKHSPLFIKPYFHAGAFCERAEVYYLFEKSVAAEQPCVVQDSFACKMLLCGNVALELSSWEQ